MISRVIINSGIRNLKPSMIQMLMVPKGALYTNYTLDQKQLLHVKTYDKDAALNKQREMNKFQIIEETESLEATTVLPDDMKMTSVQNTRAKNFNQNKQLKVDVGLPSNDDPDVFGGSINEPEIEDEGDRIEEEYISRPSRSYRKLTTTQYAYSIKEHLNKHRIKEAVDVLEVDMLKEDRVKPESYIYSLLISGCAKAGYTRKCFQLFTKMRQRGLKVKQGIYSSLFNACANAPTSAEGLSRADRLRTYMLEHGYEPNVKNYNAMIKAYGRWGDVKTAYLLVDEMKEKNIAFSGETYNFLLQACASDTQFGFRHCLLTWHKMLLNKIKPDYYSFDALLRCTRDCGFGDLETMKQVLQQILDERQASQMYICNTDGAAATLKLPDNADSSKPVENLLPESSTSTIVEQNPQMQSFQASEQGLELPNLLLPRPHLGSILSLEEVQKPHERLLLLGGLSGFLSVMKSCGITPDIEIFTTMLEVVPPTNSAEKQLLTYIRKIGLKADIDFFNILIKKRAMRFDYEGGKEVLTMIKTAGLYPDIVTYGVLALGCSNVEMSRELLEQMKQNGIRMNIQILGAMLRQGCAQKSFPYICEIMQISLDENIKPNDAFLRHLHNFYMRCARAIDARHYWSKNVTFKKEHKKFCDKYRLYQEEYNILGLKLEDAIKKLKENPYQQYKDDMVQGIEPLKNEKLARKQKKRKYIKKIKIKDLKDDPSDEQTETRDEVKDQLI